MPRLLGLSLQDDNMMHSDTPRSFIAVMALVLSASLVGSQAYGLSPARLAAGGTLDQQARFVAGLPQLGAGGSYKALESTAAWQAHQKSMSSHWNKLKELRLTKMQAWYESDFKALYDPKLTMMYPFSGPDFINAHTLYPSAPRYVFYALEDIDNMPALLAMGEPQRAEALRSIDFALRDIYSKGYFITMHMSADLNHKRAEGVVPIFMVFLARSGHELLEMNRVVISPEGALVQVTGGASTNKIQGLQIKFRDRDGGQTQELLYFDVNMDNEHVVQIPGFTKFLETIKPTNTFLKAASYLMCCSKFSKTRAIVLETSQTIFQDDTGVPLRNLDTSIWDLQLYGEYTWPISDFGSYTHQSRLMALYQKTPAAEIEHLPFPMGYHYWGAQKQNHMMVTRKPQSAD